MRSGVQVTVANLPTAFWRLIAADPAATAWPESLRLVIVGGERASLEDLRAFRQAGTSHIRLINAYGRTETTITSTSYDDAEDADESGAVPIGRPWPGVSHCVLDQHLRVTPPGALGELFIGGAGLALGYLNRPYADLIQTTQPGGPYALAGFSAGAVVALAVAEVLHRRGERTDFIGLLDAVPPATIRVPSPFTHPRRFARLCLAAWNRVLGLVDRKSVAHAWTRLRLATGRRAERWRTGHTQTPSVTDLFVGLDVTLTTEQAAMMQRHLDAVNAFAPSDEAIDVVLFRTPLDPIEGPHEEDLGWRRALRGTVRVVMVPGIHDELLMRRGAPLLARSLDPFLLGRAQSVDPDASRRTYESAAAPVT